MGAVDPILDDDIAPWWSQWTVDCSLDNSRFYEQPNGWDNRWACQNSGIFDERDRDTDHDGVADAFDQFPDDRGEYLDTDLDGMGNNRDADDDNDGVLDVDDAFPIDPSETTDSDGDGVGDNGDVFPEDPSEWLDTDNDGVGDNADIDANGNGFGNCAAGTTEIEDGLCVLPDRINSDLTLTYLSSDDVQPSKYLLNTQVHVGDDYYISDLQTLEEQVLATSTAVTIEPGVHIVATEQGSLTITRGSKLIAAGTADYPITFSSIDDGYDGVGEWGGIAVLGFAPHISGTQTRPQRASIARKIMLAVI